jgi:glycosyltransferase involved in cell wall biosynthesis
MQRNRIAYLASEYPKVTHTFIRRELKGVERRGLGVERMSIRPTDIDSLPDPEDRDEVQRTFCVLERGYGLLVDCLLVALSNSRRFIGTAIRSLRLGRRSQSGMLRHAAYLIEACAIYRYTRRKNIVHIHAHFGTNPTTVAMLVHRLGGPTFSFAVHGPGEFDAPEFIHLSQKIAEAAFVTAISDFARGQVWRWTAPEQWEKIHIVRCGVDSRFLEQEATPVPDVPRFLHVGRMSRSKAQPLILQAAAQLKLLGRSFEIVMIGDGELRRALEDMIEDLGVEEEVKLLGWSSGEAVRSEILRSRVLLLPSFGEGLPVIIMEALALARPVITTRIAGIPELVVDGVNGWLISSGNLNQIVEAMTDALDTSIERLTTMGMEGRAAVRELHDSDKEAGKLFALLSKPDNAKQ